MEKQKSSLIQKHRFDGNKIYITFNSGIEWEYEGTKKEYDEFCCSDSMGKHFHSKIKNLPGKKVEREL